ncbi:Vacuolar iron transporter-like 4 [Spatholobus suberectus]|nr:Vacuolar iron transporter-like 4 [Spatholobus suberectus]
MNDSQRPQWLLKAVCWKVNDKVIAIASLMMCIAAASENILTMVLGGFLGIIAGVFTTTIEEFISMSNDYDIEIAEMERDLQRNIDEEEKMSSPFKIALALAFVFSIGVMLPLLAAYFRWEYKMRMVAIIGVSSLALLLFGGEGARLEKISVRKSCMKVLIGGWVTMAVTFGLTQLFSFIER